MASALTNPLDAINNRALVAQWREACSFVESIPLDQRRAIRGEQADVERLERQLGAAESRLAVGLDTRRSLRDTLA